MLDIGQHKLLMLLLVIHSEDGKHAQHFFPPFTRRIAGISRPLQHLLHPVIDISAVIACLPKGWSREKAALGVGMGLARLVVRAEHGAESRMIRLERLFIMLQHKGFEEPRHMAKVPLDRTGFRHRLYAAVLIDQRLDQGERATSDRGVFVEQ